jgi:hypothetical protein
MSIPIDVTELQEILRLTPATQNILLIGKHGIGKSQIITHFYQRSKMRVEAFFLGQMSDPGDLIGLMYQNQTTGHSEFLPPYWWPTDNQPIVLFLDELNRARPEILQSVQDLTLNRTLAGKQLPAGSIVIAAVNTGDEYQLTDLDPALVSRFNVYEFAPTIDDWLIWATEHAIDPRIIQFIQKNNHFLDTDGTVDSDQFQPEDLAKSPDRRAWVKVSELIQSLTQIEALHIKIIAGVIGIKAAMQLQQSLGQALQILPKDLLTNFAKHQKHLRKMKLQDFILLNEQVLFWLNGVDTAVFDQSILLANMLLYLNYLKKRKLNEALAHLASLLENPQLDKASALLLIESPEIMSLLATYIESIKF